MQEFIAAKILGISGEINPSITKLAYKRACSKYHPDRNPAGLEMMKEVNTAFASIKEYTGTLNEHDNNSEFGDQMMAALNIASSLSGVEVEICGVWVWLGGSTKDHKDAIKSAELDGVKLFRWAPKKKKWYFRDHAHRSFSRGNHSMDDIRATYGTKGYHNTQKRLAS